MRCLLVHQNEAWTFQADSEAKAKRIIGWILLLLPLLAGGTIKGVDDGLYWEAKRTPLNPEGIKDLLESASPDKIIPILKSPPTKLDAIYLTRRQKEREGTG